MKDWNVTHFAAFSVCIRLIRQHYGSFTLNVECKVSAKYLTARAIHTTAYDSIAVQLNSRANKWVRARGSNQFSAREFRWECVHGIASVVASTDFSHVCTYISKISTIRHSTNTSARS